MQTDEAGGADAKPWYIKFIEFPLIALVVALAVVIGTVTVAYTAVATLLPGLDSQTRVLAVDLLACGGLILAYKLIIARLGDDKRDELPLADAVKETAIGLGYGFVVFTVVVAIAAAIGVYRVEGVGGTAGLLSALIATSLFPAVSEEIAFRGVLFRWMERFAGTWTGLVVSSALFGAAHMANPGATWVSSTFIAVGTGALIGGAYMLTRNLWVPIGIHFGWNFTQGGIFGAPVSGIFEDGLVDARLTGPEILSGGPFGLEASVIALVIATAAGLWFVSRAIKAGKVVGPMWVDDRKARA